MLAYFECFNTVQIAPACLGRIFQYGRIYLYFTDNDIYICCMHSPHLISIIKCHRHLAHWQFPLTATLQFKQQFVLDKTPLQMDLIRFSSHHHSSSITHWEDVNWLTNSTTWSIGIALWRYYSNKWWWGTRIKCKYRYMWNVNRHASIEIFFAHKHGLFELC